MSKSPTKAATRRQAPVSRKSIRGRTASGKPNPIDVHVGNRIRLRRTLLGMSQDKLGEYLGLTFQQVQKYERGANRVGASRMYDLSQILDVPVSYFFDDMPEGVERASPRHILGAVADPVTSQLDRDPMTSRETLELVRHFVAIPDDLNRKCVYALVKSMSSERHTLPQAAE
ncbi:MAG: helix-turn-helix transcriptional regulator [Alphaproteobacteria bacterium]|nr:helix-turn-helix transcriptional regulator [Alphaproteobacteria bacterium]